MLDVLALVKTNKLEIFSRVEEEMFKRLASVDFHGKYCYTKNTQIYLYLPSVYFHV